MSVQAEGLRKFVAEVELRGGIAARRSGTEALVDITTPNGRNIVAKLKTKQRGDWQAQKTDGRKRDGAQIDAWVFVDVNAPIRMAHIVEAEWMRNDIQTLVETWLAADPTRDATTQRHHKIEETRVADWAGRWDVIGLDDASEARRITSGTTVTDDNLGAWVFTCNPKTWDIRKFVDDGNDWIDDWSVAENYRSAMIRDGQRAILWVSGPEHGSMPRGIWGLGWTTGSRYAVADIEGDYWTDEDKLATVGWMVPTDIVLMDNPIDSVTLRKHPGLDDLEIMRSPQTSNPSWISADQLAALEELVEEWPDADPFAGGTITVSGGGARRGDPETNRLIEHAAIAVVTSHYESLGYTVTDVGHQKLGWDLTCARRNSETRHVEVKGVAGPQPSILLTKNELRSAEEDTNWELAVVTRALTTQPQLHIHSAAEVIDVAVGYVYQVDLTGGSSP